MKYCIQTLLLLMLCNISIAQKIRFTDTSNGWHVKFSTLGSTRNTLWKYSTTEIVVDSVKYLMLQNEFLIREDTLTSKVYVRLLSPPLIWILRNKYYTTII